MQEAHRGGGDHLVVHPAVDLHHARLQWLQLVGSPTGGGFADRPEAAGVVRHVTHELRWDAQKWQDNGLDVLADNGNDMLGVGRKINLGNVRTRRVPEGHSDRVARTQRAPPEVLLACSCQPPVKLIHP